MKSLALLLAASQLASSLAGAGTLAPRIPAPKQALTAPSPAARVRLNLKFADAAAVRATAAGELTSEAGADLGAVRQIAAAEGLGFAPLVRTDRAALDAFLARAAALSGEEQPDLLGIVAALPRAASSNERLADLGARLQALPIVEYAYLEELGAPPPGDLAPATPNLAGNQSYFGPNPGMDVAYAHSLGAIGSGIRLSDCEYGWNAAHEDVNDISTHPEPGQTVDPDVIVNGWDEHGTAVLGETSAVANAYGVTGMARGASVYTYPEWTIQQGPRRLAAITNAIANSSFGDVVLLEMQTTGAGGGFGPAELDPSIFAVVKAGTSAGVVVVAAAGNGAQNLDGAPYASYMAKGDSGAILVGAGSASLAHVTLGFSTYGSRVNLQGWGESVFSMGYGDFASYGGDKNQRYTGSFNGTSSASPFVASACLILQQVAVQRSGARMAPAALRALLLATGTAQGAGGHIGPLPNLRAAIDAIPAPWQNLGNGLAGASGLPALAGNGPLQAGTPWTLKLSNARPSSAAVLFGGTSAVNLPLLGGTLVPAPDAALGFTTTALGTLELGGAAAAGLPPGVPVHFQCWIADPAAVLGAAASNAVKKITP